MKHNILILSAGRRVELIQLFRKAAKELKIESNIIAADANDTAPGLYFADKKYLIPYVNDEDYIPEIIELIKKESIDLVIPTIDTELIKLSENKELIETQTVAKVLVSSEKVIRITRDKFQTQIFFEENNFQVPKQLLPETISKDTNFPLFIKPKSGSSSQHIYRLNSYDDYKKMYPLVPNPIVQEFIEGDEYTVDVFLDFKANIINIVPRLRMATRSGEISKGKIVKDSEIISSVREVMLKLKPIGHITVQLMKTKEGIKYIEINARFGGGAPMSIQSGANSPKNLYKLLMGEELSYNEDYKENITFLRFDNSIALNENGEVIKFD